jgi:aminopeptidase N
LICIAVGHLVEVEDGTVDGIPIKYYAPKGTPADWLKRSFDKTPAMVKWIQKKLDYAFPWPKYYQVASPNIGGAMENISLVSWNAGVYLVDEKYAKERKHMTNLTNIHEMAFIFCLFT